MFYRILIVVVTISAIFCSDVHAFTIVHNGKELNGTGGNFTYAKSIWNDTPTDSLTFNGANSPNYLLIDDLAVAGALRITSPFSGPAATISLYKLDGVSGSYTTTLVKTWTGPVLSHS